METKITIKADTSTKRIWEKIVKYYPNSELAFQGACIGHLFRLEVSEEDLELMRNDPELALREKVQLCKEKLEFAENELADFYSKLESENKAPKYNELTTTNEEQEEMIKSAIAKHETVELYNQDFEEKIEIDVNIAELIKTLWEIGLKTYNSCQENKPGVIWIEFPMEHGEIFLDMICTKHDDHIYGSIILANYESESEWEIDVVIDDLSEYLNEDDEIENDGPPQINLSLSVRFPQKDYTEVLKRIKQWLEINGTLREKVTNNISQDTQCELRFPLT